MKFSKIDIRRLISLKNEKSIYLEGDILKIIEDNGDPEFKKYLTEASFNDKEKRRKRLEITKQIQTQNKELLEKNSENNSLMGELKSTLKNIEESKAKIEYQNEELLKWKLDHEKISSELESALEISHKSKEEAMIAKKIAENDLDILQKKIQFELIGTVVKIALGIIVSIGIITSIMYLFSIMFNKDTQIVGSTWSNMMGILLTNAFSIIGTIMGIKYVSEKKSEKNEII